jgi:hypothetical protein
MTRFDRPPGEGRRAPGSRPDALGRVTAAGVVLVAALTAVSVAAVSAQVAGPTGYTLIYP